MPNRIRAISVPTENRFYTEMRQGVKAVICWDGSKVSEQLVLVLF